MKFTDLPDKNLKNIIDEITVVLRRNEIGEESIMAFWNIVALGTEVMKRR